MDEAITGDIDYLTIASSHAVGKEKTMGTPDTN